MGEFAYLRHILIYTVKISLITGPKHSLTYPNILDMAS